MPAKDDAVVSLTPDPLLFLHHFLGLYSMGQPMGMVFAPIELVAMALGLLLMIPVLLDGASNWLEGMQLLTAYVILGAVLWAF